MDIEKIIQLIDKVSESSVTSLKIEEGSLKISIEKDDAVPAVTMTVPQNLAAVTQMPVMPQTPVMTPTTEDVHKSEPVSQAGQSEGAPAENLKEITSPIVGIFYTAASPEAEPFVNIGDTVSKGQVVGIVEAMKLMNEIESEVDGRIAEVLVKNGEPVEYGQPLFKVR